MVNWLSRLDVTFVNTMVKPVISMKVHWDDSQAAGHLILPGHTFLIKVDDNHSLTSDTKEQIDGHEAIHTRLQCHPPQTHILLQTDLPVLT